MKKSSLAFTALCVAFAGMVGASQGRVSSLAGHVRDSNGEAMHGVRVSANDGAGKTVTVLSQFDGTFSLAGLAPGTYDLRAAHRGYVSPSQRVTMPSSADVQITLEPGPIDLADLSFGEHFKLLPESPAKARVLGCEHCHNWGFLASRNPGLGVQYWVNGIARMRRTGLSRILPHEVPLIAEYLEANFGPNSALDLKQLGPETIDENGLNIRYVTYDIPTMNAKPHTAVPDGKGNVWFTEMGGGKIGVVNVRTGKMEEFRITHHPVPRAHGITLDPSGNVWFAAQGAGTIGRFDPRTKTFTHYPLPPAKNLIDHDSSDTTREGVEWNTAPPSTTPLPGGPPTSTTTSTAETEPGHSPHTVVADADGHIWVTEGGTQHIRKFDAETEEWTEYVVRKGGGRIYSVDRDPTTGRIWWTGLGFNQVGYIEPATGKVTAFDLLTPNSAPRRLRIDAKGAAWVSLFNVGKIARIDPATRRVQEWDLPSGRDGNPYPLGIDGKGRIWTHTARHDRFHMFDPTTERFVTYQSPYKGNALRQFFLDEEGTLWGATYDRNQIIGFKLEEDR